jgi:ectoine hydroxylase-related dioxygenase (phytanoyl-CoA dioxygenase family)
MQNLENEKNAFFEQGYITFNINDEGLIDSVNNDVDELIRSGSYKTNSAIYSYNEYPRIVESYKFSENCKKLALHESILNRLKYYYKLNPKAFSTINFLHSTQQPLHSDYVHFGTVPHRMLVGAWVALEDIDPNSGPLQVVPKSHKLDLFDYEDIRAEKPKNLNSVKSNYGQYEEYIKKVIKESNLEAITPIMKKGDCLLWEANMLHGSPVCHNSNLTRKAQVTHWTFDNVTKHFNPSFSNIRKDLYVERQITFIN